MRTDPKPREEWVREDTPEAVQDRRRARRWRIRRAAFGGTGHASSMVVRCSKSLRAACRAHGIRVRDAMQYLAEHAII